MQREARVCNEAIDVHQCDDAALCSQLTNENRSSDKEGFDFARVGKKKGKGQKGRRAEGQRGRRAHTQTHTHTHHTHTTHGPVPMKRACT